MSVNINDQNTDEKKTWDIMSFADSLSSIGCSMRDRFLESFSTAWEKIQDSIETKSDEKPVSAEKDEQVEEKKTGEMNFTSQFSSMFNIFHGFNVRERISSLFDSLVPNFAPQDAIFDEDSDLGDIFGSKRGGSKFIDQYSVEDLTELIEKSTLGKKLHQMGVDDWYIDLDLSDCFSHFGYLRSRSIPEKDKYFGFLIVQIGEFKLKAMEQKGRGFEVMEHYFQKPLNILNIRWFALQNPLGHFSPEKPRLPGQRYPGTGLARDAFLLLTNTSKKAGRDGIINTPEHFHNAFLYEGFFFLNPDDEGYFQRMKHDLSKDIQERGLAAVSWAIYLGFLKNSGNPVTWEGRNQAFPISNTMISYFQTPQYKDAAKDAFAKAGPFHIEWKEAESYCLSSLIEFSSSPN